MDDTVTSKDEFEPLKDYVDEKCVEPSFCYQFIIHDSWGDGLCCDDGLGTYMVEYDNKVIKKGGNFGSVEESEVFGDVCPSLFVSYNYDDMNRRFFPPSPFREGTLENIIPSYATWPNCSNTIEESVGCVLIPKNLFHTKSPSWTGTLYSGKPPVCKRGKCDQQIAKSNSALQMEDVKGANEGSVQFLPVTEIEYASSYEDDTSTTSIKAMAVVDINLDGWPDIIVGNSGKPNQLLLNTGHG